MAKVEHGEVWGTWLRPGPGCTVYFTSPSWSVEIQLHGWKRVAPLYSTTTPRSFTPFSSHRVRLPLLMVMTRICSPIQLSGTCSSATIVLLARVVSACISYPYTALLCPSEAILAALAGGSMRDPASELPRIHLPKLSKKSLSSVSSAEIAVISQRNEPSLLCFVGF